jgi:hypothetical protein
VCGDNVYHHRIDWLCCLTGTAGGRLHRIP